MKRVLAFLVFLACAGVAQAQAHSATLTFSASTVGVGCAAPATITYNVFRGTTTGGESTTPLNSSPITTLTYKDSTVAMGNTYFYTVAAVETCGTFAPIQGASSNEVSAAFPAPPSTPIMQAPVVN